MNVVPRIGHAAAVGLSARRYQFPALGSSSPGTTNFREAMSSGKRRGLLLLAGCYLRNELGIYCRSNLLIEQHYVLSLGFPSVNAP